MIYTISEDSCEIGDLTYSPDSTPETSQDTTINAVLWDRVQSLSDISKATARNNIDAVNATEVETIVNESINEVKTEIGDINNLTTTNKTNIVSAINEVKTQINNSNPFTGTSTQFVKGNGSIDPNITTGVSGELIINNQVKALSFVRNNGTSFQFLKADGSVDNNTYLSENQTITLTGDITGSGKNTINTSLSATGVPAGTYTAVTVDSKGRVTDGFIPYSLSGYGITDAVNINQQYVNPPWITSLPWGKITNTPTTLSGYGITDAITSATLTSTTTGLTASAGISAGTLTMTVNAVSGYMIPTITQINNADTAYGWGNHANAGYLTNVTGLISSGSNITITGSGTSGSPYVISGASNYTLPVASQSELGGVKVDGTTITITNGVISSNSGSTYTLPQATETTLGGVKVGAYPEDSGIAIIPNNGAIYLDRLVPIKFVEGIAEGGTYTINVGYDGGHTLVVLGTANITVALSAGFQNGTEINVIRGGTGTVTISEGASSETLVSRNALRTIGHQYAGVTLLKTIKNSVATWYLIGDLA